MLAFEPPQCGLALHKSREKHTQHHKVFNLNSTVADKYRLENGFVVGIMAFI